MLEKGGFFVLTFTDFLLFFISLELLVLLLLSLRPKNGASNEHAASSKRAAFDESSAFDESADELDRAWRQTLTELLDYNQDKARGAARGGGQQ